MVVNIDPNLTRKTMVKILLFVNILFLIISFFSNVDVRTVLIGNIILLGVQYTMNRMESIVQPKIEGNRFASKVNDFAGKING